VKGRRISEVGISLVAFEFTKRRTRPDSAHFSKIFRASRTRERSAVVSNSQATSRISVRPARDRTPDPLIKSSLSDHTTSAHLYLCRIKSRLDRYGDPTGLLIAKLNSMILYATLARGPKLSREDQINSTRLSCVSSTGSALLA
jgi:hypothetical protein